MQFDVAVAVQPLKDPQLQATIEEQLRRAFEPSEVRMPLATALPNELITVAGLALRITGRRWHVENGLTLVLYAEPTQPPTASTPAQ